MTILRSYRISLAILGSCVAALGLTMVLFAASAEAEIYSWKDRQGKLHFAQDLSRVPPEYRDQAEGRVRKEGSGRAIQVYESAPAAATGGRGSRGSSAAAARSNARSKSNSASKSGNVYRIKVPTHGTSMRVNVRLNDEVDAPFLIDTGASDVVMPEWVAKKLNLDLAGARTQYYRTANGTVESQVVVLDSVSLGGARARNVPASVSKSMSVGLLGLSYFNHFRYRVDPVAGVVTLEDNGLSESGRIRGGRSQAQWRHSFRVLNQRREAVEAAVDESGSNRTRRREKLEAAVEEVDRQIEVLEDEADNAHVPMSWRD